MGPDNGAAHAEVLGRAMTTTITFMIGVYGNFHSRIITFRTDMSEREVIQSLQVVRTLLSYTPEGYRVEPEPPVRPVLPMRQENNDE